MCLALFFRRILNATTGNRFFTSGILWCRLIISRKKFFFVVRYYCTHKMQHDLINIITTLLCPQILPPINERTIIIVFIKKKKRRRSRRVTTDQPNITSSMSISYDDSATCTFHCHHTNDDISCRLAVGRRK